MNPNLNRLAEVGDAAGETDAPAVAAANATAAEEILLRLRDDLCDVTTTPGAGDGGDEFGLRANVGDRKTSNGLVRPESTVIKSVLSLDFRLLSFPGMKRLIGLFGDICGDRERGGVKGDVFGEVFGDIEGGLGDNIASKTVSYRPHGFLFTVTLCSNAIGSFTGVPIASDLWELAHESRELTESLENSLRNPLNASGGEFEIGLVAGVTVTPTVLITVSLPHDCLSVCLKGISENSAFSPVELLLGNTLPSDPLLESLFFVFGGESNFKTGTPSLS